MATPNTPTKPLYTARFSLLDTKYYTPAEIFGLFGPDLEKAGFIHYQTPAIVGYTPAFTIRKDSLFTSTTDPNAPFYDPTLSLKDADPDTKPVYESMSFKGPDGQPFRIIRQFAPIRASDVHDSSPADPPGTRPILEQRLPRITTIAWNLGAKAITPAIEKQLVDKLREIRRAKAYNPKTETGTGFQAIAHSWQNTPFQLANYPDRPPIPQSLLPAEPAPKPKPKSKSKPKPTPKPVVVEQPWYTKYWKGLLIGGAALLYLLNQPKPKAK